MLAHPSEDKKCLSHHSDLGSAAAKDDEKPTFGMRMGITVQAGHILWQGKYIDTNQFYKVSYMYSNQLSHLIYGSRFVLSQITSLISNSKGGFSLKIYQGVLRDFISVTFYASRNIE